MSKNAGGRQVGFNWARAWMKTAFVPVIEEPSVVVGSRFWNHTRQSCACQRLSTWHRTYRSPRHCRKVNSWRHAYAPNVSSHHITLRQEAQLSYRGTARRAVSVKTVVNVAQMFVKIHLISPTLGEWPSRSPKVIGNGIWPYDTSYWWCVLCSNNVSISRHLANTLLKDEESARDNHIFWPTL